MTRSYLHPKWILFGPILWHTVAYLPNRYWNFSFAVFETFLSIYVWRTAVFFAILSFCLCQLVRYPYVALSSAEVFRQLTCTRPWFDRPCSTLVPGFNCRSFRTFSDLSWKRLPPPKSHRSAYHSADFRYSWNFFRVLTNLQFAETAIKIAYFTFPCSPNCFGIERNPTWLSKVSVFREIYWFSLTRNYEVILQN